MGTGHGARKHGARSKKKQYKRKIWLCNRDKDIDQIQDELEHKSEKGSLPAGVGKPETYDDELPGGGQFYCEETARYFSDAHSLAMHKKTKFYKRRVKQLKEEKYTQDEADRAAGMTKEMLPPAHKREEDDAMK